MSAIRILVGDCIARMRELPDESVHCCVTSPPYWGLRDYGHEGQIGLEGSPCAYVSRLVDVFREVRRCLRADGTLWLNLGDSYAQNEVRHRNGQGARQTTLPGGLTAGADRAWNEQTAQVGRKLQHGLKAKDLVGIPWRVAFALQADGWWLRSDCIWAKPSVMPESVTDRPTKAHEYVFLLAKSERYHFAADAVREGREGRNVRTVWRIASQPFDGAHFATMPPALAERCIKASCPEGGTVLDPFGGAGTTALVAGRLQRDAIVCELNPAYAEIARARIADEQPMFSGVTLEHGTQERAS